MGKHHIHICSYAKLRKMIEYLDFKNLKEYINKSVWLNGKLPEPLGN